MKIERNARYQRETDSRRKATKERNIEMLLKNKKICGIAVKASDTVKSSVVKPIQSKTVCRDGEKEKVSVATVAQAAKLSQANKICVCVEKHLGCLSSGAFSKCLWKSKDLYDNVQQRKRAI